MSFERSIRLYREGIGNINYSSPAGGYGSVIFAGAYNGLSVDTTNKVVFGQEIGASGNPAGLLDGRELPMNGNAIFFTDNVGISYVVMPSLHVNKESTFSDGSTGGISTYSRSGTVQGHNYGEGIQEFSFVDAQVDFYGYIGVEAWPYVNGSLGSQVLHGKFTNYINSFSAGALWDGSATGAQLDNWLGLLSACQSQGGSILNAYDVYASEINTVQGTTFDAPVTNHYNLYAEPATYATSNFGVYINGLQINYFGGQVGIGTNAPDAAALLDVASTTKGMLLPRMTTTQKNAIAAPPDGLLIFDTTLGKACIRSTTWQTITSI